MKTLINKMLKLMAPVMLLCSALSAHGAANGATNGEYPIYTSLHFGEFRTSEFVQNEAEIMTALLIEKKISQYNLQCKKLRTQLHVVKRKKGVFNTLYSGQFTLFCSPRPFGEQAIISLQASCIKSPQQECFNQALLEKLNNIESVEIDQNMRILEYNH